MSLHEPRSSGPCLACGSDWPCHTFRLTLYARHGDDWDRIHEHMVPYFVRAAAGPVGAHVTASALHGRYLGWISEVRAYAALHTTVP